MKILKTLSHIAFALTVVLIPFRLRINLLARPDIPVYKDFTDILLFASDLVMLAMLTLWGMYLIINKSRIYPGPKYLWLPLLGLILAGWMSVPSSADPVISVYHSIRLMVLFLFYLYVINEIDSPVWVIIPVGIQGLIQAVIGIAQSILQRSIELQSLGEWILDPMTPGVSIVSAGGIRFLRAYGLSDHPNLLGGCLAFALILLLAAYLRVNNSRRLWVAFASLPISLGLLLTFSRSAWVAFLSGSTLVVGVEVFRNHWKPLKAVLPLSTLTALVLSAFVWLNLPYFAVRLNAGNSFENVPAEKRAIDERLFLAATANELVRGHLLNGVGLGASPVAMKDAYPEFPVNYQPPHFAFLAALLETGISGAVFYALLIALPWIYMFQNNLIFVNSEMTAIAGLLLAITIIGLFDYYMWLTVPGRSWQWLAWGLLAGAQRRV